MIRQTWFVHAQAPLARHQLSRRLLSSSAKPTTWLPRPNPNAKGGPKKWEIPRSLPQAVKGAEPLETDEPRPRATFNRLAQWRSSRLQRTGFLLPSEDDGRRGLARQYAKKNMTQGHMLVVEGLSTNLHASDFSRLAARDLSDWQSAINEVHQERDPWTLDPLGTYRISFSSQAASTVYRSKLDRLFKVAQHKLRSTNGLWVNTLPDNLRSAHLVPEDEVELFTIAPGTLTGALTVQTSRVKGAWPWQRLLGRVIRRSGFAVEPAVVLVHLHNWQMSSSELEAFIHADGAARDEPWDISKPYPLTSTLTDLNPKSTRGSTRVAHDDKAFRLKLKSRHVLICKSPDVAWRFIRSWNQRTIGRDHERKTAKAIVTASYIEV
ncbi:hypothetical protein B0T10DRAFT_603404 [Thelonectria olida]|uniref:Uncharacterized protein n=1 Tax=Thelonectria olida TaxID=1576542 RepID=A0A9P9AR17_9HYPO|nr:hypothetical protein B0T10DRAFT_603404 [Thelonectria olida]